MQGERAPTVVLVGARTVRQGTGPFIAAGLQAAGAEVAAIVGTSEESVREARSALIEQCQIEPRTYTELSRALEAERPDAVVICSPWRWHGQQLAQVARAGSHCLVEKPLVWPASLAEVEVLVAAFEQRGLLLQMVAQWPCTLPSFIALHGPLPQQIDAFQMGLSPISIDRHMITDSAPHFISMLQALLGPGDFEQVQIMRGDQRSDESGEHSASQLALETVYSHPAGRTSCQLHLRTSASRPRPAWYQVNELRVDREVELPEYQQYFSTAGDRVPLPDPIHQVAARFVRDLAGSGATAGEELRAGHRNLLQLAAAWP